MVSLKPICGVLLTLILAFMANASDTYKWRDDNGQIQFTDKPPSDRPFEVIKQRRAGGDATEPPTKAPTTNAAKTPATANKDGKNDLKSANCETAKNNQRTLSEVTRIKVTDPNGEQRFLSDEERAARLKQAEKDMQYWCEGK